MKLNETVRSVGWITTAAIAGDMGLASPKDALDWCTALKIPYLTDGEYRWVKVEDLEPHLLQADRVPEVPESWLEDMSRDNAARLAKSRVYVIKARFGLVKIGVSTNFKERFASLSTASPAKLEVLALFPGTPQDERALHKRFAKHRQHGEWFEPVKEILDWAASMGIKQ